MLRRSAHSRSCSTTSGRELFGASRKPAENTLTLRQRQVILAIAKKPDNSYATTASLLGITENTLKGHLRGAFSELGVTNIASCIIRCMQLNLIPFTVNADGSGIQFGEVEGLAALSDSTVRESKMALVTTLECGLIPT